MTCASQQSSGEVLKALLCTGAKRGSLGAYFTDLPPNMLGSWLMGLLAASSTLGLNTGKMLAILPAQHPWQVGAGQVGGSWGALVKHMHNVSAYVYGSLRQHS